MHLWPVVVFILLVGWLPSALWAQPVNSHVDPPARVARLSLLDGNVSLRERNSNNQSWQAVERNRPLLSGDQLWTDEKAHAEIQLGILSIMLAGQTWLSIETIDDAHVHCNLIAGTVRVKLSKHAAGVLFDIDTPHGAVRPTPPALLRLNVDSNHKITQVIAQQGNAQVFQGQQLLTVVAKEMLILHDSPTPPQRQPAPLADDFDNFTGQRQASNEQATALRYVSPATVGYEDLGTQGQWQTTPQYGPIWIPPPTVVVGWAPYRFGHWVYLSPWGWTWIDQASWGYAPFHYGRWAYWQQQWVWAPGPYAYRPCYAPALVAFLGFGVGVGVTAWFPLAPYEVYRPAYFASPGYIRGINNVPLMHLGSASNPVYRNRVVGGGVSWQTATAFANGGVAGAGRLPLAPHIVTQASVIGTTPAIAPMTRPLVVSNVRPSLALQQTVVHRAQVMPVNRQQFYRPPMQTPYRPQVTGFAPRAQSWAPRIIVLPPSHTVGPNPYIGPSHFGGGAATPYYSQPHYAQPQHVYQPMPFRGHVSAPFAGHGGGGRGRH